MKKPTLTRKRLKTIALNLAKHPHSFFDGDVWRLANSRLYKLGQIVWPAGNGWGAINNWHRPFAFVTSLRTRHSDNGGYLVVNDKGTPTILTNIRSKKTNRSDWN